MTSCFDREDGTFRVLINHEEQYSIWPDWKAIPAGWTDTGILADKQTCLDHIDKVWTDMRPLSLRRFMDGQASAPEQ
ncbi:MbtH family NRPS accessory protein [Nitrosovibrio sp. Nv17]|uniref:MbtH family protein n=1 Tax=Nitrosovibrio sp. Nv17 TaxID=1855339 RepID=UPI0009089662|nr:MbtH family NRPS accessory protein [Nitrosovibrio sp. Nv17]SFW33680.1 MbtH protein [Nitrosovibrio sp. Nv17]